MFRWFDCMLSCHICISEWIHSIVVWMSRNSKWLSVCLRTKNFTHASSKEFLDIQGTKWFWVHVQLQSLNLQILPLLQTRSSLKFTQLSSVASLWNAYMTWQEHTVKCTVQISSQNTAQWWLSICLRTMWFWVWVQLQSLNLQMVCCCLLFLQISELWNLMTTVLIYCKKNLSSVKIYTSKEKPNKIKKK